MRGWRARLGFLIPPGNPTIEPEMMTLAPAGVSVHFSRMVAPGEGGSLDGQEERNRSQIAHIDESADLLIKMKPSVMMLAHTASSYTLGRRGEAELMERMRAKYRVPVSSAFGSVVAALNALGAKRVAYGAPYSAEITAQGKRLLEDYGFEVVSCARLDGVTNIFDETPERAYQLGRMASAAGAADVVFLSGVGMPTVSVLAALEEDTGKPAISSASATMWNALRLAGLGIRVNGYGRLLEGAR